MYTYMYVYYFLHSLKMGQYGELRQDVDNINTEESPQMTEDMKYVCVHIVLRVIMYKYTRRMEDIHVHAHVCIYGIIMFVGLDVHM